MMKVLIFLIIYLVAASRGDDGDRQVCEGSTCGPGQCCMKGYYGGCNYCADLPGLGELCVIDMYERYQPSNQIYTGGCPCQAGLYCDKSKTCQIVTRKACNQVECKTGSDCPEGQCCVRDFSNSSPSYCAPFTEQGDLCFSDMVLKNESKSETFMGKCPCEPGFECDTLDGRPVGDRECYEIEKPPERTNKPCNTGDDCSDSECCVLDFEARVRECRPFLKDGQKCDNDLFVEKRPEFYDNKCPCAPNVLCAQRCFE